MPEVESTKWTKSSCGQKIMRSACRQPSKIEPRVVTTKCEWEVIGAYHSPRSSLIRII